MTRLLVLLASLISAAPAFARAFPSRAVHTVVSFATGFNGSIGTAPLTRTVGDFTDYIRKIIEKSRRVVKTANLAFER
ncbi:MAG: hypothetical protein ACK59Y_02860 [Betaproteobacteria bacterium]|jgi:hypothetical protein